MARTIRVWGAVCAVALAAVAGPGCDVADPTSPTPRVAEPITEVFSGTLQPAGAAFYSFTVSVAGSVSLTLTSVTGSGIPDGSLFPLGIGTPVGDFCDARVDASAAPGATPQYTTNKSVGIYCARISDNAFLTAPATFVLTITHPK